MTGTDEEYIHKKKKAFHCSLLSFRLSIGTQEANSSTRISTVADKAKVGAGYFLNEKKSAFLRNGYGRYAMQKLYGLTGIFAAASAVLAWLYFALVLLLDQSIGGRSIGTGAILLSLPFAAGGFYFLTRYVLVCGYISHKKIFNISLGIICSVGCILILDIGYSLYLNFQTYEKPHVEDSRKFDPVLTVGELYPRLYFPTDNNFRLHKPNFSVSGSHYGSFYSPELMLSPILAKSVFQLNRLSCSIDKYGFRNSSPLDQAEVFALGDSFTFGWAIDVENSWIGLLRKKLDREIYNLGIHDSSPKQELELLKYLLKAQGQSMHIQTLLWMIYEGNDLEDNYGEKRPAKKEGPGYVVQLTQGNLLKNLVTIPWIIKEQAIISKFRRGEITFRLPNSENAGLNPYMIDGIRSWYPLYQSAALGPRLFYPYFIERAGEPASYVRNHPHRPLLDKVFTEMAGLEKEYSFKVIVIIIPTAVRLHGPFYDNFPPISPEPYFINYVAALSEKTGFQTLNLLPLLKSYGNKELLYLRDDDHWNARGHEVAAELIHRKVLQHHREI